MLEEIKTLKLEYYRKNGIQANTLILGRENFTALLKDKKAFRSITLTENFDILEDLTILQVHNLKMFKVGYVE